VSWLVVALLVVAATASVVRGQPVWTGFVAGGLAVLLLPAAVSRDPLVMPVWELVALAALPIASQFLQLPDLLADVTVYAALLAVAVVVVVELHVFTPVEMTPRFAVAFLALTTLAAAGVWTILQFASDVYVGTRLVGTKTTLMWDLVLATAVGLGASPLAAGYFGWLDGRAIRGQEVESP
jgi:hypothetical protein